MINKSRKNSFLSNNLKNTSEINISNLNPTKNLAPVNNSKIPLNNIFSSENFNSKSKNKILPISDILSPNNNEIKIQSRSVFSVDKDNRKISNDLNPQQNSIFNKLNFDNAITKKAINSLAIQEKNGNNNLKNSFNEKGDMKNSNINLINNSCNNNSNLNNFHNNERLSIGSSKLDPAIANKSTNINNKIISNLNSKANEIIQLNNMNNHNNNLNNINSGATNNFNLINNNNFNSGENFTGTLIPLLPPQQINVNINNYNINNYNIQSAIPLKSNKKFFKFENINLSHNKNSKNFEHEFSPKNFSNMNSNLLSPNTLNPLNYNNFNNNNLHNNNESLSGMANLENKEFSSAIGKRSFGNGIGSRFNFNKILEEAQGKKISGDSNINNNLYNNEKNNLEMMIVKEKSLSNNNFRHILRENILKDGINNSNYNKQMYSQSVKSGKILKRENNINKNENNFREKDSNGINNNKNDNNINKESLNVNNSLKKVLSKEIIFDPAQAKNLESLVKPTEINNDSVINELADLFSATSNKDVFNFNKNGDNNNKSFFNNSGKDLKLDMNLHSNLEEDLNINLNKYFFSDNKNSKNQNLNSEKFDIKSSKNLKNREFTNIKNKIISNDIFDNETGKNNLNINENNNILINKKINFNFLSNEKSEKIKKNIKIKIENNDALNAHNNNNLIKNSLNVNLNQNNGNINNIFNKNNNFNNHNINNYNIHNINRIYSNKIPNINNINTNINNIYNFKIQSGKSDKFKKDSLEKNLKESASNNLRVLNNNNINNINEDDFNMESLIDIKNFPNENSLSLKNSSFLEDYNHEIPDPRINFDQLKKVNSQRPQTSYGGLSERQKSLQLSLRQIGSKLENNKKNNDEEYSKLKHESKNVPNNENFHSFNGNSDIKFMQGFKSNNILKK